jgi:hypothetical protein
MPARADLVLTGSCTVRSRARIGFIDARQQAMAIDLQAWL